MRDFIKLPIILFLVALIAGALLGLTNYYTKEPIKMQHELAQKSAREELFEGCEFVEVENLSLSGDHENIISVFQACKGDDIKGHVVTMNKTGYGGDILLNYGVNAEGFLTGVIVGTNSETPGLGAKASETEFAGQFPGKTDIVLVKGAASDDNEVSAITAATITSQAIVDGANQAIEVAGLVMEN